MGLISPSTQKLLNPYRGKVPESFLKWLDHREVPSDLRDYLHEYLFKGGFETNVVDFYSPEEIIKWNEFKYHPDYIKHGYLMIGCAMNGDGWAIDFNDKKRSVVAISHDEFGEGADLTHVPTSTVVKVASNLDQFIQSVFRGSLPVDYYEAEEWRENGRLPYQIN